MLPLSVNSKLIMLPSVRVLSIKFFVFAGQIFIDSDCYDYDPTVDELFDTATDSFTTSV